MLENIKLYLLDKINENIDKKLGTLDYDGDCTLSYHEWSEMEGEGANRGRRHFTELEGDCDVAVKLPWWARLLPASWTEDDEEILGTIVETVVDRDVREEDFYISYIRRENKVYLEV